MRRIALGPGIDKPGAPTTANPTVPADPFSDILRLTRAETVVAGGVTAGGAWAVRFPAFDKMKFFGLVKGGCWLSVEGEARPFRIGQGDVVLLTGERAYVVASDLAVPPTPAEALFQPHVSRLIQVGEGEDCVHIGGNVRLDPLNGRLLAEVLPPVVHVRSDAREAPRLQWLLGELLRECLSDLPGGALAIAQIAQLLLVQVLRAHLAEAGGLASGWLRVLGDPRLAVALRLMHAEPGRDWTLADLAQAAAMSRSAFAQKFRDAAGVAPLAYLTQWRMRLGGQRLRDGSAPVAEVASALGYGSESAFSHAFKRATGLSPQRYRAAAAVAEG